MPLKPLINSKLVTTASRLAGATILALLLTSCASSSDSVSSAAVSGGVGAGNPVIDALFAEFDQPGSPGCGLAVAQDGEIVYSRGYGYANLDYDIPNTPETLFDVGSVTKQFNAACVSMLALEGKLSFDDDIRDWLPELPEYERPITIRHLLHHTGGLRDYLNLFPLAGRDDYYPISLDQILAMMSRQRAPIFPAGEKYAYSNTGYMLLAKIIERASGQSLGQMAQERIFDPLGMTGSHMYEDVQAIIPHRAIGYDRNTEGELRIVHNYNFDIPGDGQLYATMPDLLRWDGWLHGEPSPEIYELMLTDGQLDSGEPVGYALGLVLGDYRGLRTVRHSGGSWGFLTQLVRFVEPGLSIAVSCNSGYAPTRRIVEQIADHYLADLLDPVVEDDDTEAEEDEASEEEPEPPPLTAEQMAEWAGEYFSVELDATYRLAVEADRLVVRVEQDPPIDLSPAADEGLKFHFGDQALGGGRPATLRPVRNAAGRTVGFTLDSWSERGIVFERR
jgi:CubicO group peptidase (beta-lactamase class C family)